MDTLRGLAVRAWAWCAAQRRWWPWVAASVAVVGYLVVLWWGAGWIDRDLLRALPADQRLEALDRNRSRLLQLGAGLVAVGVLWFTARNYLLSREGQVTDRFDRAIAHLASDKLDERLGGIYSLERIMRDSAKDHETIVEVLAVTMSI